jgi:hypothetical protein
MTSPIGSPQVSPATRSPDSVGFLAAPASVAVTARALLAPIGSSDSSRSSVRRPAGHSERPQDTSRVGTGSQPGRLRSAADRRASAT